MNLFDIIRFIMYWFIINIITNSVPTPKSWYAFLFIAITELLWFVEYNDIVHKLRSYQDKESINDKTKEA